MKYLFIAFVFFSGLLFCTPEDDERALEEFLREFRIKESKEYALMVGRILGPLALFPLALLIKKRMALHMLMFGYIGSMIALEALAEIASTLRSGLSPWFYRFYRIRGLLESSAFCASMTALFAGIGYGWQRLIAHILRSAFPTAL